MMYVEKHVSRPSKRKKPSSTSTSAAGMDKKLLSRVMRELGKSTSAAKAKAARENGKKGGRPRKEGSK